MATVDALSDFPNLKVLKPVNSEKDAFGGFPLLTIGGVPVKVANDAPSQQTAVADCDAPATPLGGAPASAAAARPAGAVTPLSAPTTPLAGRRWSLDDTAPADDRAASPKPTNNAAAAAAAAAQPYYNPIEDEAAFAAGFEAGYPETDDADDEVMPEASAAHIAPANPLDDAAGFFVGFASAAAGPADGTAALHRLDAGYGNPLEDAGAFFEGFATGYQSS